MSAWMMGLAMSIAVSAAAAALGMVAAAAPSDARSLKDLAWLAGDWELREGADCVEEHWTLPGADKLIGMSRTVDQAGRTKSFEFVRIEARADGIYYVAQPSGRPGVDFKLTSESGGSATEWVFANPGHADHLKRIIYRRDGSEGLAARIEGENNGKVFAVDFPYRRAPSNVASRCGAVK
jgi:hypothetical protein